MNTYDRKRRRLGKVLLPGVYLGESRDFNLRSRPFSVSHKTPKSISPAKPREWPNFKITTVFKPETGNMPRACLDGGDVFNRVLPEVLTPMLKRYGASDQKHRVFSKSKLCHVSVAIPHSIAGLESRNSFWLDPTDRARGGYRGPDRCCVGPARSNLSYRCLQLKG